MLNISLFRDFHSVRSIPTCHPHLNINFLLRDELSKLHKKFGELHFHVEAKTLISNVFGQSMINVCALYGDFTIYHCPRQLGAASEESFARHRKAGWPIVKEIIDIGDSYASIRAQIDAGDTFIFMSNGLVHPHKYNHLYYGYRYARKQSKFIIAILTDGSVKYLPA